MDNSKVKIIARPLEENYWRKVSNYQAVLECPEWALDSYAIQQRGENYSADNRVHRVTIDLTTGWITATVMGTQIYESIIVTDEDVIVSYDCSCPYWTEHEMPCKHLVAVSIDMAEFLQELLETNGILPPSDEFVPADAVQVMKNCMGAAECTMNKYPLNTGNMREREQVLATLACEFYRQYNSRTRG
jgi:hypothetical protein